MLLDHQWHQHSPKLSKSRPRGPSSVIGSVDQCARSDEWRSRGAPPAPGPNAKGLSAKSVTRLKAAWWTDYEAWQKRDLGKLPPGDAVHCRDRFTRCGFGDLVGCALNDPCDGLLGLGIRDQPGAFWQGFQFAKDALDVSQVGGLPDEE